MMDEKKIKDLIKQFDLSISYEAESERLSKQTEIIQDNITTIVSEQFAVSEPKLDFNNVREQLQDISKQWSILSASMTNVKTSIKLPGFSNRDNLYCCPLYGIKEYKRHVRYSLSNFLYNIDSLQTANIYYQNERFFFNYNYLDFKILQNISRLDRTKVQQLIELTKDIIYMFDSWKNFYNTRNIKKIDAINEMRNTTTRYGISDEIGRYKRHLRNLNKLLSAQKEMINDMSKRMARWQLVINKWEKINKNFLILHELRKSKLKI